MNIHKQPFADRVGLATSSPQIACCIQWASLRAGGPALVILLSLPTKHPHSCLPGGDSSDGVGRAWYSLLSLVEGTGCSFATVYLPSDNLSVWLWCIEYTEIPNFSRLITVLNDSTFVCNDVLWSVNPMMSNDFNTCVSEQQQQKKFRLLM